MDNFQNMISSNLNDQAIFFIPKSRNLSQFGKIRGHVMIIDQEQRRSERPRNSNQMNNNKFRRSCQHGMPEKINSGQKNVWAKVRLQLIWQRTVGLKSDANLVSMI